METAQVVNCGQIMLKQLWSTPIRKMLWLVECFFEVADYFGIGVVAVGSKEGLHGLAVLVDKGRIVGADLELRASLFDRLEILLDQALLAVLRFVAHDDKVALEAGNVFDDEGLALRRDQDFVADGVDAHTVRLERCGGLAAIPRFEHHVVRPDVLIVQHGVGLRFMDDDAGAFDSHGIEKKSVEEVAGQGVDGAYN